MRRAIQFPGQLTALVSAQALREIPVPEVLLLLFLFLLFIFVWFTHAQKLSSDSELEKDSSEREVIAL